MRRFRLGRVLLEQVFEKLADKFAILLRVRVVGVQREGAFVVGDAVGGNFTTL